MEIAYGIAYILFALFAGWKSVDEKNWLIAISAIIVVAIGSFYIGLGTGIQ